MKGDIMNNNQIKDQSKVLALELDTSYLQLPSSFYSIVKPNPVPNPKLVLFNEELAHQLGLQKSDFQDEVGLAALAGNYFPDNVTPIAQAYAGHQFGHFTMLGDGRAMLIGEYITPDGERVDFQLKGSGRTPYSRGGDGRAALGPMLREYIISEAMFALNIPTTRTLAVVTTGQEVVRETELPGAIMTRVAQSHIRVGTFQFATAKGDNQQLKALADYTIHRHYPHIETLTESNENRYLIFLKEVIKRQAYLIAQWQLVGFIHGVMNTDNMTISGESIDYGPCAFMDVYHPNTVFSSIDNQGRYAYGNQPKIGLWNLTRFAEALLPLLHEDQEQGISLAEEALSSYRDHFDEAWTSGMCNKLGLITEPKQDEQNKDERTSNETIIQTLLNLMQKYKADYTDTFLHLIKLLTEINRTKDEDLGDDHDDVDYHADDADHYPSNAIHELLCSHEFIRWKSNWLHKLDKQDLAREESLTLMRENNPVIIPRNHLVEEALEAVLHHDDYSKLLGLLKLLANPFDHKMEIPSVYSKSAPANCNYRTFCGT
jgi:uncharacterized protein YdiU (UPF0061 family)